MGIVEKRENVNYFLTTHDLGLIPWCSGLMDPLLWDSFGTVAIGRAGVQPMWKTWLQ